MNNQTTVDPSLLKGRMTILSAVREVLAQDDYIEVQTPLLHSRLSGFERGTGFSTFSASLGERLWFRAAPELYLKRLLIDGHTQGLDKIFEIAICARDEYDEEAPANSFDRPEFTLLEVYAPGDNPGVLERLLARIVQHAVDKLAGAGEAGTAKNAQKAFVGAWPRRLFSELLRQVDPAFDLEGLLQPSHEFGRGGVEQTAAAIESRATNSELRDASASLAYKAGNLARYMRSGPQSYWHDFIDHVFRTKIAPSLDDPVIVEGLPLEASPLADSMDGVHSQKWELYAGGVRIALGQKELMDPTALRARFENLEQLRGMGYDLLPEPDEGFLEDVARWPKDTPVVGLGVYVDRLAGYLLGILPTDEAGQGRMIPNLFKAHLSS